MKALILAAALAAQPAPPGGDQRVFAAIGYVDDAGEDNGGWIRFIQSSQRFRLPTNPAEADVYRRLIAAAVERGMALRVRYDALAGRADPQGYVEYPLCSLSVPAGPSFGDEGANCPAGAPPRQESGERALALGLALASAHPAEARPLLARAAEAPGLSPSLRAAALRARGDAAVAIAEQLPWAGDAQDRILVEALADYRRWAAAAPDEPLAQYAIGETLADLGGYEETLAIYRAIAGRWPDEAFRAAVRIGAVYRQQGRYAEALRTLDDYAARNGTPEGMRFRYHRAWTLNLLERPREALEDLRVGFQSQPDYPYAFFMRACANAKLGLLREALADQERGMELLSGAGRDDPAGYERDLSAGRAAAEGLRALIAAGSSAPSNLPCDRLWERSIRPRSRSALLDAAAPGASPR